MHQDEFEKQTDKSVIESQAIIMAIIENTSDNIWAINTRYEIIYINAVFRQEFLANFGVRLEKGTNILDSLPQGMRSIWKERYDRAFKNEHFVFEDKIETGKSTLYVQVAMNPILVDGKVIGASFFASNITARKKIEQILRDSEEKHRTLFENMAQGVVYQDSEGRIINTNGAAEKILGLSLAQMQGRKSIDPNWKAIHENGTDYPGESHPAMVALNTGKPVLNNIMGVFNPLKDGYTWININAIPQFKPGESKPFKVFATFDDVTERKNALEKLKISEVTYRGILNEITELLYIQDEEGRFLDVNAAVEKIYGYNREYFIGKTPEFLSAPGMNDLAKVGQAISATLKGEPQHFEFWGISKEGRIFPKEVTTSVGTYFGRKAIIATARDITERKKVEKALSESEEKYRLMVQYSTDPIFGFNPDETYRYVNEAFSKAFGKKPEEIIGRTPHAIFPFDEAERRLKLVRQVFKTGVNGEIEVKVVTASNEERYYLTIVDAIKDLSGEIQWVSCISKDITERKNAEIQVKRNLRFTEALLKSIPTPFFFKDTQGRYLGCNLAFSEQLGVTSEDIYGKTAKKLWPDFQAEVYHQKDMQILANPEHQVYEHTITDKKGQIRNVIFFKDAFYDENGQVAGIVGAYIDITERKQAEEILQQKNDAYLQVNEKLHIINKELIETMEKLEESEFKIRSMVENTLTGFVYFTPEGQILEANPAAIKILGSPSIEATKQINVLTFKPLIDNGFANEIINCIHRKIVITNELIYESKWKKKVFIKYFLIPIIQQHKVVGVWASLQDFTDLWVTQNDLKTAKEKAEESDRLKSAFLANMSHEIRTPMNGILGFANLLKSPNLTGEKKHDFIDIIEKSGERLLNIINDLIDISKIESGQMEAILTETNIYDQIQFIYSFFKPEVGNKGMKFLIRNQLQPTEFKIITDREKLYAILTNLVKNAIKYSDIGFIELGCSRKGEILEFFVKDTGIGIPISSQKTIFDRFVQADTSDKRAAQGAGLGLSIAKAYVQILGGNIGVVSKPGEGSCFYFTIPFVPSKSNKEASENKLITDTSMESKRKLKILIAEDDETSDLLISIALKAISFEILHAKTGAEAVERCQNNPDIDLILMDIKMPQMDGYEATKSIRQFNKEVIIIAQTAFVLPGDQNKAMEAGCSDYIAKPINSRVLMQMIEKHWKGSN